MGCYLCNDVVDSCSIGVVMNASNKRFKDIDEYIDSCPKDVRNKLRELRQTIRKSAPKAKEAIKYGMPTFIMNGNLVHFAMAKNHIGFYPTPGPIIAFKKELSMYETSKGAIRFPLDEPLPFSLVTRIVKYRVRENQ